MVTGHRGPGAGALGEMGASRGCKERTNRKGFRIKDKMSGMRYARELTPSAGVHLSPSVSPEGQAGTQGRGHLPPDEGDGGGHPHYTL